MPFNYMDTISEITYNNNAIIILRDKNNMIWFSAYDICKILGYKRARDIIINLVNKKHTNKLKIYLKITNYIQMHNQNQYI